MIRLWGQREHKHEWRINYGHICTLPGLEYWLDGWHDWSHVRPPDVLVEVVRNEWRESRFIYPQHQRPEMNVANLYWRLTGIGKHEMEASDGSH